MGVFTEESTVSWEKPQKIEPAKTASSSSGKSDDYDYTGKTPQPATGKSAAEIAAAARLAAAGLSTKATPAPAAQGSLVIKCDESYAIYFCAVEMAQFVGTGPKGVEEYKKQYKKSAPGTIFDNGITYKAMTEKGIKHWFIVTATPENTALAKKYGAIENTLVVCASNGDALGVFRCDECKQSQIVQFCKYYKDIFDGYTKSKKG